MRKTVAACAGALATLLAGSVQARAATITIDFAVEVAGADPSNRYLTPGGSSTYTHGPTGVVVNGFFRDQQGGAWTSIGAFLFLRNVTNDHGIGMCIDPHETADCATGGSGGGNVNELDNADFDELIQLVLPAGYEWVSFQLSSLDPNGGDGTNDDVERGEVFGLAEGDPNGIDFATATPLLQFAGDNPLDVEPAFLITNSTAPYLYFRAFDWTGNGDNNDYLLYKVTIRQVPEPATLALLAVGAAGAGLVRRRRS
jgi:hypothetical protein